VPAAAPGVLHVDLDAIRANWRTLVGRAGGAEVAGVVKADAYGLGADRVGPALWAEGCRRFFVATLDEALGLRAVLPAADVAVLGGLPPGTGADFVAARVTPVLNSLGEIARWRAEARARGLPLPALVHLHVVRQLRRRRVSLRALP